MSHKPRKGYLRASDLAPADREHVLNAYQHRHTGDHWGKLDGPLQFRDDQDWLLNTYFRVTKKFRLDHRVNSCESHPTWPDNPELRKGTE
jgi:hypothetical protein